LPFGTGGPVETGRHVITVTKEGEVFYEERKMTLTEVAGILSQEAQGERILIRADKGAAYGDVVAVLGVLGKAGLGQIGLAVEDGPAP
jgi:biopolymer transport protein ExbD